MPNFTDKSDLAVASEPSVAQMLELFTRHTSVVWVFKSDGSEWT
jgi:hypothetical protein